MSIKSFNLAASMEYKIDLISNYSKHIFIIESLIIHKYSFTYRLLTA